MRSINLNTYFKLIKFYWTGAEMEKISDVLCNYDKTWIKLLTIIFITSFYTTFSELEHSQPWFSPSRLLSGWIAHEKRFRAINSRVYTFLRIGTTARARQARNDRGRKVRITREKRERGMAIALIKEPVCGIPEHIAHEVGKKRKEKNRRNISMENGDRRETKAEGKVSRAETLILRLLHGSSPFSFRLSIGKKLARF